jgi:hypothetical protein
MVNWYAPIKVSAHALARARDRLLVEMDEQDVRGEVRLALLEGRYSTQKPNWTRGVANAGEIDPHAHFAWDADAARCWVIVVGRTAILVKTLIIDPDASRDRHDRRLVRVGMTRT